MSFRFLEVPGERSDPWLARIRRRTNILAEAHIEGRYLELELTEGVAMEDPSGAVAIMNELSEIGVGFSIDDFGTGYSSLSYLKRLRASKLKIDQSFVRGLADDPEDQAIVKAIINLASSLGVGRLPKASRRRRKLSSCGRMDAGKRRGFCSVRR